jgi:tRNA 2-selenouridine synthase SelU
MSKPIFCENKPPTLGSLQIPQWLFQHMQQAPVIWLEVKKEIRLQRLLSAYGSIEPLRFKRVLCKLSNQLTTRQIHEIILAYESGKKEMVFQILMEYYDLGLYYKPETKRIIVEVLINEPSVENMIQIIKLAEGFFRSYNQIPDLWMNLG